MLREQGAVKRDCRVWRRGWVALEMPLHFTHGVRSAVAKNGAQSPAVNWRGETPSEVPCDPTVGNSSRSRNHEGTSAECQRQPSDIAVNISLEHCSRTRQKQQHVPAPTEHDGKWKMGCRRACLRCQRGLPDSGNEWETGFQSVVSTSK